MTPVTCPDHTDGHLFRDEDSDDYRACCSCGALDPSAGLCICCEEQYTRKRVNKRFICDRCAADGYVHLCYPDVDYSEPPF